jgi:formate/nitrite transporter FocA (FNT family)
VEPVSTITSTAAFGSVIGATIAVAKGREDDASYVIRGMVAGAVVGIGRVLIEALSS